MIVLALQSFLAVQLFFHGQLLELHLVAVILNWLPSVFPDVKPLSGSICTAIAWTTTLCLVYPDYNENICR